MANMKVLTKIVLSKFGVHYLQMRTHQVIKPKFGNVNRTALFHANLAGFH